MDFVISNLGKIALGIVGGFLLFFIIKNFAKIAKFTAQVRTELIKVSWPTRKEVMTSSLVILTLTAFLAIFIGIIDLALSKIVSIFLR